MSIRISASCKNVFGILCLLMMERLLKTAMPMQDFRAVDNQTKIQHTVKTQW